MDKDVIIPIGNYILVSKVREEETTESGLILSVSNNSITNNRGVVKAIGDKVNTDEDSTKINIGDTVLYTDGADVRVSNSEDSDVLVSIKSVVGLIRGE